MKKFIIILLFFISLVQVQAQEQVEKVDKNTVVRILDWVSIFTMYSDVELSDKVDLKEYAEAADLISAFITNPDLSEKIRTFKDTTCVNVYPKGLTNTNEWIFQKLNEVSEAQYNQLNAPYIILEVHFTPVNQNTAYMVSVILKGSSEITQNLREINSMMDGMLSGLTFAKPRDAKETVNEAIFSGLAQAQALFGDTYVPDLAISHAGERHNNNNTIEFWQRTGESIELEAVDKNLNLITGSVTWTNAQGTGSKATVSIDVSGTTAVTVKAGALQSTLNVKVKEFSVNIEDLLKNLLVEVINEKITKAREDLEKARTDSVAVASNLTKTQQQLDIQSGFANASQYSGGSDIVEEIIEDDREGTQGELEEILRDPVKKEFIELNRQKFILLAQALLQIKIEVFLEDIIKNEGSVDAYVRAIKDSSPQLLVDLILNMAKQPENRTQVKDIVVNFLNAQIDEVVSKS